jgi:HEPN domain-containing protein
MSRRHTDWLVQAQRDLKAARDSLDAGNYEWTAFQAQQGAEKALKAFLRYHNFEARGHTLVHLLSNVQDFHCPARSVAQSAGAGPPLHPDPLP